ncbi:hypothetical protein [Bradyrhizobium sp. UFLA05-112]
MRPPRLAACAKRIVGPAQRNKVGLIEVRRAPAEAIKAATLEREQNLEADLATLAHG